jgi:hypothetical protein
MAAAVTAQRTEQADRAPIWIQSVGWDVFWMFAGLWGVALLLIGTGLPWIGELAFGLFALQRGLSIAHAWSTTWMVLGSDLLAEQRRENPAKYLWRPLGITVIAFALGIGVATSQRYPADGSFGLNLWIWGVYIGLFWVGHFWHFGNQDFGVLTLYRSRAGQDRWLDRRIDKLFTATLMFVIQPVLFVGFLASTAFSEMVLTLVPVHIATLRSVGTGAVSLAALLTVGYLVFEARKPNRSLPKLLYGVVIFLHPALLYTAMRSGSELLGVLYIVAYLWSHWLIAVGLVARINTRHYLSRGESLGFAVLRHSVVVGLIAGAVLLLTAPFLDYVLFNTAEYGYKARLASIEPAREWLLGLAMGFFLAEQLVHYYCDRCLFRFRDAAVRRKVGPLVLGDPRVQRA